VHGLGGQVHWCADRRGRARRILGDLPARSNARTSPRASRWSAEEIALNDILEANGIAPIETDLGEYIIQLRGEPPSHIIAPAVH
jgi:L-lactate dehydrogenase complex protein LldF